MPAYDSLFDVISTKPLLALNNHSLSHIEPLICSRPSFFNHEVSLALVTGAVTGFVFSENDVSKRGSLPNRAYLSFEDE